MSFNKLKAFGFDISNLKKLRELLIGDNLFTTLPKELALLRLSDGCDIKENPIELLPKELEKHIKNKKIYNLPMYGRINGKLIILTNKQLIEKFIYGKHREEETWAHGE